MLEIQTLEEMLDRWSDIECTCDLSVGHLCEVCHDTQVLRDAIKERDKLTAENARLREENKRLQFAINDAVESGDISHLVSTNSQGTA